MNILSTLLELYGTIATIYLIVLLVVAFQPSGHLSSQIVINDIVQALTWPLQAYSYFFKR